MTRIDKPVRYLRASAARGIASESAVDRKGGDYGAGVIRGMAIVTRGEALGHDLWLDQAFVEQTASAMKRSGSRGVKARFTHPGLSSDGMGRVLGRVKNPVIDGDVTRGDLHLMQSAHNTPDGDLATYVMDLAEEDPSAFGNSIVFEHDIGEEERFEAEHTNKDGMFTSPDKDNSRNLPHARLSAIRASDVVDEPAANPNGLFHRGDEIASEADSLLSYALGLSEQRPELVELSVDPDRVSGFVKRFMDHHGLKVVEKEAHSMSETTTTNEAVETQFSAADVDAAREAGIQAERERFAALSAKFSDPAFVAEQFAAGHTADEALSAWDKREIDRLKAEVEQLKAGKPGGAEAVGFSGSETADTDFLSAAKSYAAEHKCTVGEAQRAVARQKPELFKQYKDSIGAH